MSSWRWRLERSFQIADNLGLLDMALHEWIGLVYYRLSGPHGISFRPPGFDPPRATP